MTKEQAIKHLKLMQSGARNAIRFKKNDKEISEEERKEDIEIYQDQLEALEIATKLLEQQPSDDCVSRADTLKKFEDRFIELQKTHQKDKQLGVNWCINTLKDMPPVTPTQCIATVQFNKEELRDICNERIEIACQHGTCKDCKHCGVYDCGYTCHKNHWGKISTEGNLGGMGDFYCADFEKRGNENG